MAAASNQHDLTRVRLLSLKRWTCGLEECEQEELSERLAESSQAREEYWEITSLHAQLEWQLGGKESIDRVATTQLSELAVGKPAEKLTFSSLAPWVALAATLLLAIAGTPAWWNTNRSQPDPAEKIAATEPTSTAASILGRLASLTPGSSWSFGRAGANNTAELRQGDTIYVESGAAELRLTSGTVASLEAPVVMQAVSIERFRLINGDIKVQVPEGAEGFTVDTGTAEVVDLGTVFSVSVADGNTDLVVFDGEVDLKLPSNPDHAHSIHNGMVKRFRAGEAVQVARDGTLSRIVNVQQTNFDSLDLGSLADPVVTEVRDNYTRAGMWSFYEIVPGGMREDAKAFVDRPHEWNGFHSSGMPDYLMGGDCIKTFNDDKVIGALEMEVTLAQPATLYVLLDQRLDPPAWLTGSFEPTGDEIGLDEVHFNPLDPSNYDNQELSIGPGKSINRTHSIWKRVVPRAGIVSLGANGELAESPPEGIHSKANMYGLIAVLMRPDI